MMQKNLKIPAITLKLIYVINHLFNISQSYLCNYQVNASDI